MRGFGGSVARAGDRKNEVTLQANALRITTLGILCVERSVRELALLGRKVRQEVPEGAREIEGQYVLPARKVIGE